jgi:hypothetical protein
LNPFSQCLTIAANLGSDISWYGFTRYSSSRDRVVLELFFPRVYDFFQYSRLPIKSADVSAQDLSAALKMILFRRLRIVTSAFSRVPSAGKKEVLDWAAMIVVQFACRMTSTLQSESEMNRCASSCQQISKLSSSGRRLPGGLGSNRRSA